MIKYSSGLPQNRDFGKLDQKQSKDSPQILVLNITLKIYTVRYSFKKVPLTINVDDWRLVGVTCGLS